MVVAGINFGLHFMAWSRRNPVAYFADWETRTYLLALGAVATVVCFSLMGNGVPEAIRMGIFQTVSIATTTGFTVTDFSRWPSLVPYRLLFAAVAGGCAGSTAGGIKIVRVLLIAMQGYREIKRLIHPSGVFQIKLGRDVVGDRVTEAVWGFFSAYVILFLTMVCVVMGVSGMDFTTSFSSVAACLNNLGPGLGDVALNYAQVPALTKWILILGMLLGRLEIFTLLVLLTPAFWRR
jgi:trk system potassium uptake protein TrkH